jgi:type II secretory pathway component PulM
VSGLLGQIQQFFRSRSAREQWILALSGAAVVFGLIYVLGVRTIEQRVIVERARVAGLQNEVQKAIRLSRSVGSLQGPLRQVEERITPGEKTNLFTLLEALAQQSQVKDQLESIKPKQPSGNKKYPETRVEVSLKGASLAQIVQLLYRIETASAHLIVRSVRIKSRPDDSGLLDVSLSVSSFERA